MKCDIVDYCNNYSDTHPCAQPRFENVTVEAFLEQAKNADGKNDDEMLDNIFNMIKNA